MALKVTCARMSYRDSKTEVRGDYFTLSPHRPHDQRIGGTVWIKNLLGGLDASDW